MTLLPLFSDSLSLYSLSRFVKSIFVSKACQNSGIVLVLGALCNNVAILKFSLSNEEAPGPLTGSLVTFLSRCSMAEPLGEYVPSEYFKLFSIQYFQ